MPEDLDDVRRDPNIRALARRIAAVEARVESLTALVAQQAAELAAVKAPPGQVKK